MGSCETLYYLYCLTPGGDAIPTSGPGVDGRNPILVCRCGDVGAVYSKVEREEFCGEAAEADLQDLAWLSPRVCRHEAAIEEVMRRAPVLPARFATLFSSLDRLQEYIQRHGDAVRDFLALLGDQQEWAIKGLLPGTGAPQQPAEPTARAQGSASPGLLYFERKRMLAQSQRDRSIQRKQFRRRAAVTLRGHARNFRERHVLFTATDASEVDVLWNWAFLVAPASLEDFRKEVDRLNGDKSSGGVRLVLTGPWPPYSFVPDLLEQEAPAAKQQAAGMG